ncbi:unnamed protein product [Polarella glacialis]|uniref:PUL domain-containing protein n=1 Tax=Polarella glacialis TaxID=89957 RepID=A0A813G8Z0_POLGL|nr:unnamed protein product [Polarella glacialis]
MLAQDRALRQLAAAQPAGLVFASVDIGEAPEVAAWAGVKEPEVRLLQPEGVLLLRLTPTEVRQGALHTHALALAGELAAAAVRKLGALAARFPGALHDQVVLPSLPKVDKMQQHGLQTIQEVFGASSAEEEAFASLCQCCHKASALARVRSVAALARLVRRLPPDVPAVPFLDLCRRLTALKLIGAGEPGAREALELLLDAVLRRGLEVDRDVNSPRSGVGVMLALQCVASCFAASPALAEALLPMVVDVVTEATWTELWQESSFGQGLGRDRERGREAAAMLLLNASVALRSARLRASQSELLRAALAALKASPEAVGGSADDAKVALQAQPRAPLRALAAAVFRGELDGPVAVAPPHGAPAQDPRNRRPYRAPLPARLGTGGGVAAEASDPVVELRWQRQLSAIQYADGHSNGCPQKRFDCEAGSGNWINSWPSEKQAWCCANEQKGCQAHHVNLYSCDGSTDQLEDWSVHKRDWCCTNRGVGCHVAADISTPGFHCHVALNNWHAAWSPLKKTWCCEHRSVGCPETQFQAHAGLDHYQYHVGSPLEGQPLQQQLPRVTSRHAYFPGFQ